MKNLKYIFIAVITLIIVSSCSNFDEINTDPNKPATVNSELLATEVLKSTYRFWNPNPSNFLQANVFNKHTAILKSSPEPGQYYSSYFPFGSFGSYVRLTSIKRMVEFAEGTESEPSFKGLALFLKASYGFNMTLVMGDIPYSEAGMAEEGITRPKYDKQENVFNAILNDLKQAETYFAEGINFKGDIMLGGNAEKWQKLCNAMQLKVLQTMSKKITPEQKARFAEIVENDILLTSNADNLQLVYTDNPNADHPFWDGEQKRVDIAVSKLVVDALKNLNDRRLFYFAEPAAALLAEGKLETDFDAYEGALTSAAPEDLNVNNQDGKYSLLNKRYVEVPNGDPMIHFSYAEQCFIIAEAIEEGWVTGDAEEYYKNGVKAALDYFKSQSAANDYVHGMAIDNAYIDTYFTGDAAYATAGTKEDRLKQILTQRWLIDFFQGNGGNYPQFLRTGYPNYPLDPTTSLNEDAPTEYPKRWKYPESEQTTNPENYKKAIDEQFGGFDSVNKSLWYQE